MSEDDQESPSRRSLRETPDRASRKPYDLGVLFVHGIGSQKRSEHLVQMGEALVRWLGRWIGGPEAERPLLFSKSRKPSRGANPWSVRVTNGRLVEDGADSRAPASAEMSIRLPGTDDEPEEQRWLLAESHWAEEFLPPSFLDFCRWGFFVVPWTIASHFVSRIRRDWNLWVSLEGARKWWLSPFVIGRILFLALFMPIVGALGALIVSLLLVVAAVPLPWTRRWLGGVQRTIAGTLGDSLVLLEKPLQAAALVGRVVRDIQWIRSRCERLAIVAHSQGAAVSHRALSTGVLAGDDGGKLLLFTFGSGLRKLDDLERFRDEQGPFTAFLAPVGLAMLAASPLFFGWIDAKGLVDVDLLFGLLLVLLGSLSFLAGIGSSMEWKSPRWGDLAPERRFGVALRWCDRWAAADPVPNGPLFDQEAFHDGFSSEEHENYGSAVSDHTGYHRNPDGFLASLAQELVRLAGLRLTLDDYEASILRLGRLRRAFRVRLASMARSIALCAAMGALVAFRATGVLDELGARIYGALDQASAVAPAWLAGALRPVTELDDVWLGVLGVLAGVGILYAGVAFGWKIWNWFDIRCFFQRQPYRLDPRVLIWVALAVGVGAVTVAWVSRRLVALPADTDSGPLRPLTFFCLVAFGALISELIGLWMAKRPRCDTPSWLAVSAAARALVAASASFYVLYPSALLLWRWGAGEGGGTDPWIGILNGLALVGGAAAGALSHRLAPELQRLAAVGDPEAALCALESDAQTFREATPTPREDPGPPGPG